MSNEITRSLTTLRSWGVRCYSPHKKKNHFVSRAVFVPHSNDDILLSPLSNILIKKKIQVICIFLKYIVLFHRAKIVGVIVDISQTFPR